MKSEKSQNDLVLQARARSAELIPILFSNLERILFNSCYNPEIEKEHSKLGAYKFIPFEPLAFMECLSFARDTLSTIDPHKNQSFLDVGCGWGSKMFLARQLYFSVCDGVELNKEYVRRGRQAFGHLHKKDMFGSKRKDNSFRFFNCDARQFGVRYADYDVVYFYCPMFKPELQLELETAIGLNAKKGAIIIAALERGRYFVSRPTEFELLTPHQHTFQASIYRKL